MPSQTHSLTRSLNLSHHEYRLYIDASGLAGNILDGRVMEDGKEVFTIHSTAEDEGAVKRILLAEAHRRSNRVFAESAGLGDWTCQAGKS